MESFSLIGKVMIIFSTIKFKADFELLEQMVSVHKTKIRREIYKRVCKDRGCPDIGKFGVQARNVVTREE